MLPLLGLLALTSAPVDPALITARLAAAAPLRSARLVRQPPNIPASAWARAAQGSVITGTDDRSGVKLGWGVGVFDVPIDTLWAALNDELRQGELLGLGHVELTAGAPCADRRHVMMLLPLPVVSDRWWVVENRYATRLAAESGNTMRELSWTEVADPAAERLSPAARAAVADAVPVASNHGAWLLISLDATHTLAEYHARSDPGGELPAGAAAAFATSTIASTFEKIHRYAQTTPSSCLGKL